MRQLAKPKSTILTTLLVVTTFAIVNCQKAPNRNGVKANPAAPANKVDASQVGTEQCSGDIVSKVNEMRKLRDEKKVVEMSSTGKSESEKNDLIKNRKSFLDHCSVVAKALDAIKEKACKEKQDFKSTKKDPKEIAAENERNNINLNETKQSCTAVCTKLAEDGDKHDYCGTGSSSGGAGGDNRTGTGGASGTGGTAVTDTAKKAEAERKTRAEEFLNIVLEMSKELKETSEGGALFSKYFRAGKIESGADEALKAANKKEVVCSLGSIETKIDKDKKFIAKFVANSGYSVAKKETDLKNVSEFKGDATSLNLARENDHSEATFEAALVNIVCLNVKHDAVDVNAIKNALGGHLKHITAAAFKKTQDENKVKLEQAAAERARQAAAKTAPVASAAPAVGAAAPATGTTITAAAPVAVAVPDKAKLLGEITVANTALSAQATVVQTAEARVTEAKDALEDANQTIIKAGQQDAKIQTILAEGRKIIKAFDEATAEVEAAKTKSKAEQDAAAAKLKSAVKGKNEFVKKNSKLPSMIENDDKRLAALAKVEQETIALTKAKEQLPKLKEALDAKIKLAKDAKIADAEINNATAPAAPTAATAAPAAAAK